MLGLEIDSEKEAELTFAFLFFTEMTKTEGENLSYVTKSGYVYMEVCANLWTRDRFGKGR